MPAMATRTVADERSARKRELEATKDEAGGGDDRTTRRLKLAASGGPGYAGGAVSRSPAAEGAGFYYGGAVEAA